MLDNVPATRISFAFVNFHGISFYFFFFFFFKKVVTLLYLFSFTQESTSLETLCLKSLNSFAPEPWQHALNSSSSQERNRKYSDAAFPVVGDPPQLEPKHRCSRSVIAFEIREQTECRTRQNAATGPGVIDFILIRSQYLNYVLSRAFPFVCRRDFKARAHCLHATPEPSAQA